MIELYFWTTPNGYKPLLFLEEASIEYALRPVNISKGEQFEPEFLKISPNNRIPAIVDYDGPGETVAVFESGAILQYLAEKTGQFLPSSGPERADVLQWLHWQMGGVGPMVGQSISFNRYIEESVPYAIKRYVNESRRLFEVLDRRLDGRAGTSVGLTDPAQRISSSRLAASSWRAW